VCDGYGSAVLSALHDQLYVGCWCLCFGLWGFVCDGFGSVVGLALCDRAA